MKTKSCPGIRSPYVPQTARLIGGLLCWPQSLHFSSAHNELGPAELTGGFNQNVAHCLKDQGQPMDQPPA